ncbi:hypothetical protein GCM10010400_40140 [Streptomyces aculeolatus]|uniref:M12 family metallo-peptidase n=1 Tax=Streptomyces aculeolatus TaxID=270689 RepID=UPI001CEDCDEF|nr:hypothetical protein [Streptomyces aculeolatus]
MHIRRLATVVPAAVLAALAAAPAHAADGPVYAGKGWKAFTSAGIYSISPDPYVIDFASTTARDRLAPALKRAAAQITAVTGVKVTVSSKLRPGARPSCSEAPRHVMTFHYKYRPTGKKGMSHAWPCTASVNGSAWGGAAAVNSEYWTTRHYFSKNSTTNRVRRDNVIIHELGHLFGLAHANTDRDRDGRVEGGECVQNSAGRKPVMCTPTGGYHTAANGGQYTTFDAPGLKQMRRNYDLR